MLQNINIVIAGLGTVGSSTVPSRIKGPVNLMDPLIWKTLKVTNRLYITAGI